MPAFAYKARTPRGELLSGRLEGVSMDTVADELMRSGLTPVDIRPEAEPSGGPSLLTQLTEDKVRDTDLMLFARQMSSLLKAGVPILRALGSLADSSGHRAFQSVLRDIRDGLSAGRELSVCMHRHPKVFPAYFVNLVRIGESTGRLDEIFMRLFKHLEFEKDMRERVKSALRYPSFVVFALFAAVAVINIMVIPAFAKVYKSAHAELPLMTRILISVSEWSVQYWPYLLLGLAAAAVGLRFWLRTDEGRYRWDRALLKLPIAGPIVHKAALARFSKGLAMTYQSGIPIVQGLSITAGSVGNRFISSRIEQMRTGVERGDSITGAARTTAVFTPVMLQMMRVGEETGELDRLLLEIGEMYQREVEYEIGTLSQQIEPILIAGLGIIVLVVALGVFLPIWDLSSTMGRR